MHAVDELFDSICFNLERNVLPVRPRSTRLTPKATKKFSDTTPTVLSSLDTMYSTPSVASRPLPPSPNDSFHPPPPPEKYHSPSHSQPGSSRPSFSNEAPSLPPIAVWNPSPPRDSNDRLDTPVDSAHRGFPSSPVSPSLPTDGQLRAKKANPLQDLLDSEDQYVQLISAIIRVRTMIINVITAHYYSSHYYLESCIGLVSLKLSTSRA